MCTMLESQRQFAVPPKSNIFPSDLKSVLIVNLPPVYVFWNSCFENSAGNSHQCNCLLGFVFFFPLFSIHTGEPEVVTN